MYKEAIERYKLNVDNINFIIDDLEERIHSLKIEKNEEFLRLEAILLKKRSFIERLFSFNSENSEILIND